MLHLSQQRWRSWDPLLQHCCLLAGYRCMKQWVLDGPTVFWDLLHWFWSLYPWLCTSLENGLKHGMYQSCNLIINKLWFPFRLRSLASWLLERWLDNFKITATFAVSILLIVELTSIIRLLEIGLLFSIIPVRIVYGMIHFAYQTMRTTIT